MESLKYTYLFGGGAIRGAAHVGVLKALQELGAEHDTLGGSSVGSIVAALYAVGYTTEELQEIFLSVNFELFRDISFGFNTKFALSKGEVFLDWFRELIEKKFYGDKYDKGNNERVKFKDLTKNLIIISTNMLDFTCCEFSNFETPDFEVAMAVRISCCMPGLMRAINVEDKLLVDGDLSKNLRKSKNRILEIRLEGEFSGDDKSPVTYVNGMYSCMTYSETSFIKELYGNSDNYDYLVINTGDVVVVDFNYPPEKRQQIIDSGYEQTIKYFKEFLPQKKKHLFDIYDEILDRFRNIQGFMLRKKYSKAKTSIAELYILLAKEKDIISQSIYKEINEFQKLLYSNVKTGLLGHSYLENKNLTEAQLRKVIDILTEHFNEFKNYFKQFPV